MKAIIVLALFAVAVFAWCPWVTEKDARTAIIRQFDTSFREKKTIYSGACTITNIENMHKVWFGYDATATYNCEITGEGKGVVTYTFYNGVLGVPTQ